MSVNEIADKSHMSWITVKKYLKNLEKARIIVIKNGKVTRKSKSSLKVPEVRTRWDLNYPKFDFLKKRRN